MEELRRKFAENLYYKACELAEHDLEELDNGDDLDAYLIEQKMIAICEAVFKEMIFVEAGISELIFATLPTDREGVMSEVSKKLPPALQKGQKE
jgi:hypothetical protein